MKIFDVLLDLIYPKRCVICAELIPFESQWPICADCEMILETMGGIVDKNRDDHAIKLLEYVEESYSVLPYVRMKKGIQDFKFRGCKRNGIPLGNIMTEIAMNRFPHIFEQNNLILAVPIHKNKLKQRGFNQAAVLAENMVTKCGLPFIEDVLIRIADTKPQSGLDQKKRIQNVENAFAIERRELIKDKNILLIDDIHTTGATLNGCAKQLVEAGAKKVTAYTLSTSVLEDD